MDEKIRSSKKAQVTIFIILALIIIVAIVLIFILMKKPEIQVADIENPQAYIEGCVKELTQEAINVLSEQGGDINPQGSVMFRGRNITYLCYTSGSYKSCTMQRPMLIEHIEKEIADYINPKVDNCFRNLKKELEKKNYEIQMGDMNLKTNLKPGHVIVNIKRRFIMTKREKTQSFDNFKMDLVHPIYDLSKIAMEIANQESQYCNFDVLGFMIIYPQYDINKFRTEGDTIYSIREIKSNQKFVFAIRSCVMPAGLF